MSLSQEVVASAVITARPVPSVGPPAEEEDGPKKSRAERIAEEQVGICVSGLMCCSFVFYFCFFAYRSRFA